MLSVPELTRKRVSILNRYFSYACDNGHPFQIEDLKNLRKRFAANAATLKDTPESLFMRKVFDFCGVLPEDQA